MVDLASRRLAREDHERDVATADALSTDDVPATAGRPLGELVELAGVPPTDPPPIAA